MRFKPLALVVVAMVVLVIFSACTRTASTPVPKTIDTQSEGDFPVLTEIGPTQLPIEVYGTQTAQALLEEGTLEPPAIVETPTPEMEEVEETSATSAPEQAQDEASPEATQGEPEFPVFEGYGPGFPTFGIRGVVRDKTVTIQANDFPEKQTYVVRMGPIDTGGVNGTIVETKETGSGGSYLETYNIPEGLKGSNRIAIRIEFSGGRYAVNWFYNTTTY